MTIYFDTNKEAHNSQETITNFGLTCIAQIDDEIWTDYAGTYKWDIVNGAFTDITNTDEYKAKITAQEKTAKLADLTAQILALDLKRIRASIEPSVKDPTTGQTWLEYYTAQIQNLRTQLIGL